MCNHYVIHIDNQESMLLLIKPKEYGMILDDKIQIPKQLAPISQSILYAMPYKASLADKLAKTFRQ